jgi:hypothetical protein
MKNRTQTAERMKNILKIVIFILTGCSGPDEVNELKNIHNGFVPDSIRAII